jgi:hypothetical protein
VSTKRFLIVTALLYTVLTAVMTYPQVLHLRDGVHDDGDPLLNAWALAWVAHELPTAPKHLFDANIFYPERRTLAFSETLLAPGIAAAPLRWAGLGPILVYNIVFLSGFILSGVGTALLVRRLTGRADAGIVAGLVFAFLPFRIDHYPHLQLQQTQCLPFALWALHRLLDTGRLRDGILFGLFTAGQILSCMYYGLFLVPYFAVVCGVLLVAAWRSGSIRWRSTVIALAAAALLAGALVAPVGRAYLRARAVVGERSAAEVVVGSATLGNYLGPAESNALYGTALKRFADSERRLFPGFIAIALAVLGAAAYRPKRSIALAYLAGLILAVDVSLGFHGVTYRVLYDHVLPFRGLRIPARMGIFAGFSIAVLAGLGTAWMRERVRTARAANAVIASLAVLMLIEYASRPIDLTIVPTAPLPVYADLLRDVPAGQTATVAEFPASDLDDPTYMYNSTFHWQNLVNGYSGFFPRWYAQFTGGLGTLPAEEAIREAGRRRANYLVVHGERLRGGRYDDVTKGLEAQPGLRLISRQPAEREGQHGQTSLYRILDPP